MENTSSLRPGRRNFLQAGACLAATCALGIYPASAQQPPASARFRVDELPEPLQRYMRFTGAAQATHRGMRAKLRARLVLPGRTNEVEVVGTEYVSAVKPQFDWLVKAQINWLLVAHIEDRYADGVGSILSRMHGVYPVIDDRNIAELNSTQLARWSGLTVIAPTGFLLRDVFRWRQTGADEVEGDIRDGQIVVRQRYTFDAAGRLVRSESSDRWERYDGVYKRTGSIMERSDYVPVAGVQVPSKYSVTRIEPDGTRTLFLRGEYFEFTPVSDAAP